MTARTAVVWIAGLMCLSCHVEMTGAHGDTDRADSSSDVDVSSEVDTGLWAKDSTDTASGNPDGTETARETEGGCISVDSDDTGSLDTDTSDTSQDTGSLDTDTSDTSQDTDDLDTDTSDTPQDTDVASSCPSDMVLVSAASLPSVSSDFCMDRYEASRPDATAVSVGVDTTRATSRAGVLPWYVNQMSTYALETFEMACQAAGKRLCHADEWQDTCRGPEQTTYVFGNTWDSAICNSVDTWCSECCDILGIDDCPTAENCGYSSLLSSSFTPETCFVTTPYGTDTCHVCFHVMPTGSFSDCSRNNDLFDINGNVWEVVPVSTDVDPRGYQIRGGAFNCGSPSIRFRCTYNASWSELYAGFRCCRDV